MLTEGWDCNTVTHIIGLRPFMSQLLCEQVVGRGLRRDTAKWEQSAAYFIDRHPAVETFVKNAGLGFAIPYLHNGQMHDYIPDFIVRLKGGPPLNVILETKGFDLLEEVKRAAAERWVKAVNADGTKGRWFYTVAKKPAEIDGILKRALENAATPNHAASLPPPRR